MRKSWYESKTIWGSLILVILAIYGYLSGSFDGLQALVTAVLGWMGIGLRLAVK